MPYRSSKATRRKVIAASVKAFALTTWPLFLRAASTTTGVRRDAEGPEEFKKMIKDRLPNVFETPFFTAAPCLDCDVPGYLVLQPKETEPNLHELSLATQRELGPALGSLENSIRLVTKAEHVYVLRFSEGLSSVHFHIFPRTQEMAQQWNIENPSLAKNGINGPLLFAWARIKHHVDNPLSVSTQTRLTAAEIAKLLVPTV